MKVGFVLDSDREFTAFTERHLTIFGYQVQIFSNANEFLEASKTNPQLIIVGELNDGQTSSPDFIKRTKSYFRKSAIIHTAKVNELLNAQSSIKAGATEFIEKDGATFVRLRTSLDALEKANLKEKKSIVQNIKKALLG
jgi:DNA-binding NtrC family response regulator